MKQVREHWGSRIGFILATAGSAIGLGSLWRFPYVTGQNGGGLFVLLYLVFTFFIALPVFIGELVIGRSSQLSAVGAFSKLSNESPNWKLLGWLTVLTTFLILS
jgi:NSS family neurotransmitter:Na+ symporter